MAGPRIAAFEPGINTRNFEPNRCNLLIADRTSQQRQGERFRRYFLGFRPGHCDDRGALRLTANYRDGRIRVHFIMKSIGFVHLDQEVHGEARGDQSSQFCPILIPHPPVSTDESACAPIFQLAQPCFEEGYVKDQLAHTSWNNLSGTAMLFPQESPQAARKADSRRQNQRRYSEPQAGNRRSEPSPVRALPRQNAVCLSSSGRMLRGASLFRRLLHRLHRQ